MKIIRSQMGLMVAILYVVLVIMSVSFLLEHRADKFGGLFLVALTFPWSIILSVMTSLLGASDSLSLNKSVLIMSIGAIPNVIFLYYIYSKIEASFRHRKQ
jgi:hypothetical protein